MPNYPNPETAARLLAEKIRASDMFAEGTHSEMAAAVSVAQADALRHAAWLLGIECLVDDILDERGK